MKKIEAIIERANDGTYSIYCKNESFSGMGESVEAAKNNMLGAMDFFKQTAIEKGFSYPSFLDEDFEIIYKFDTDSLLKYYSGILSLAGLEKITGIHQKQLWSYLHHKSKPRRQQIEKIETGLHTLGRELTAIAL